MTNFGKALRIAPAQSRHPIASFWRFWVEGSELYVLNRDYPNMKISIHASGQIHWRPRERDLRLMASLMPLSNTPWQIALEIRYLIAAHRTRPRPRRFKKKDERVLVEVADGQMLVLDLLVAPATTGRDEPDPPGFAGALRLWEASLADGRHAVLLGRVMPLDEENHRHIERLRGSDGPKVTVASPPASHHTELIHIHSGPDGNVVLIVPAGDEVMRKLGAPASHEDTPARRRQPELEFVFPDASCEIHAPNGASVATLAITGSQGRVTVSKNEIIKTQVGAVTLSLQPRALIPGGQFVLPTIPFPAVPTVAGLSPQQWIYEVTCAYDGTALKIGIGPNSVGLIANGTTAPALFSEDEQLSLTCPSSGITLEATPQAPSSSAPLDATLILHSRQQP